MIMEKARFLIFEDATNISPYYKKELINEGYEIDVTYSVIDAGRLLSMNFYSFIIIETRLKGKKDYENVCTIINKRINNLPVIINTGNPTAEIYKNLYSLKTFLKKSSVKNLLRGKMVFFISI